MVLSVSLNCLRLRGGVCKRYLPDEIIVNILSRLPAQRVLVCRTVCKNWLILTSSPYFAQLHLQRSKEKPALLMQSWLSYRSEPRLFMISSRKKKKIETIKKLTMAEMTKGPPHFDRIWCASREAALCGTCDGLALFRLLNQGARYMVCNFVTREQVVINPPEMPTPQKFPLYSAFSIFYHKPNGEYRVLFWYQEADDTTYPRRGVGPYHIFSYSLKTKLWTKITNQLSWVPAPWTNPVVINNTLYWKAGSDVIARASDCVPCKSSIITFEMDRELFSDMPHPGYHERPEEPTSIWHQCITPQCHRRMFLFQLDGRLCFTCIRNNGVVEIWLLEDCKNWCWVKRHNICIYGKDYLKHNLNSCYLSFDPNYNGNRIIGSVGDETRRKKKRQKPLDDDGRALVDWLFLGVTRYHFSPKTIRKLKKLRLVNRVCHVCPDYMVETIKCPIFFLQTEFYLDELYVMLESLLVMKKTLIFH